MAEDAAENPNEGKQPIFIQQKSEVTYGLKTGDGYNDCVPFKVFNKEEILEEVNKLGFMCDFFEVKGALEAYPEEEFLLVFDQSEGCGERWFICTSPESKKAFLSKGQEEIRAKEEAEREAAEAEAARLAAEEAERNIVYKDEPIVSRPWETGTQEGTEAEIAALNLASRRPLLGVRIACPRALVNRPITRQERPSEAAIEYRTHKVPPEDFIEKKQGETGVQAGGALSVASTQTTWRRLVNKTTVGATMTDDDQMQLAPKSEAANVLIDRDTETHLVEFLDKVTPILEEALQQNEAVNVFADAFLNNADEESGLGAKGENEMKELRTFTDLEYSKNNALSAIDWLPGSTGSLAVSVVKNLNFDERVSISGQVDRAYILLWDFGDLIHPQLKLRAPKEVFCFRFNPTQPLLVVAGLLSGQVALWDMEDSMHLLRQRRRRNNRKGGHTDAKELGDEEVDLPPVDIAALSSIDASHKRMVADLVWLPWDTQINSRGRLLDEDKLIEGKSYQFLTVASDGQLLVWDIRYEYIMQGNMPWLAKPRAKPGTQSSDGENDDKKGKIPWLPLYRSHLKRLEGVGELSLCRLCLAASGGEETSSADPDQRSSAAKTQFFCATEEGDLVFGDWQPGNAAGSGQPAEGEEDDGVDVPECVLWTAKDHSRPCVSLQQSPFFEEVFLSVGDWSFQLWKLGVQKPIFSSPISDAYLTNGRWSPSRPAVLFISRIDGSIDVWDFTDTSYRHSQRLNASPNRITSIEFLSADAAGRKENSGRQLLAVGDSGGNLHVFDIPRPLGRPIPSEKIIMGSFLEKETSKVFSSGTTSQASGDEEGQDDDGKERQDEGAGGAVREDEKATDGVGRADEQIDDEEAMQVQLAYEELEKQFLEGLDGKEDN